MEEIKVLKFVLEDTLNTLRLCRNAFGPKEETCLDRCIKRNIIQLRKVLDGVEITGLEGLEKIAD